MVMQRVQHLKEGSSRLVKEDLILRNLLELSIVGKMLKLYQLMMILIKDVIESGRLPSKQISAKSILKLTLL